MSLFIPFTSLLLLLFLLLHRLSSARSRGRTLLSNADGNGADDGGFTFFLGGKENKNASEEDSSAYELRNDFQAIQLGYLS